MIWKDIVQKFHNNGDLTIVAVCLVGAGSFFAGRYTKPAEIKTVEKQVVVTQEKVKVVEVEKSTDDRKADKATDKRVHTERTETVNRDGSKVIKTVSDTNVDKTVHEVETKTVYVDRIVEKEKKVTETVTVTKTIDNHAKWLASLGVGTTFNNLHISGTAPYLNPLLIDVSASRRLWLTPFFIGLWGQTNTNFSAISGGLKLTLEIK